MKRVFIIFSSLFLLNLSACSSYQANQDAPINSNDCIKQCSKIGKQGSYSYAKSSCECNEF